MLIHTHFKAFIEWLEWQVLAVLEENSFRLVHNMHFDATIPRIRRKRQAFLGFLQRIHVSDEFFHVNNSTAHA